MGNKCEQNTSGLSTRDITSVLPNELLLECMIRATGDSLSAKVRLLRVSREWYCLAMSYPQYWSAFTIRRDSHIDGIPALMERSRNVPLDVYFDCRGASFANDHRKNPTIDIVPHIGRLRSLSVAYVLPFIHSFRSALRSGVTYPVLQNLQLTADDKYHSETLSISAPLLRQLHISNWHFEWAPIASPFLQVVKIQSYNLPSLLYPFRASTITDIISAIFTSCARLRHLHLQLDIDTRYRHSSYIFEFTYLRDKGNHLIVRYPEEVASVCELIESVPNEFLPLKNICIRTRQIQYFDVRLARSLLQGMGSINVVKYRRVNTTLGLYSLVLADDCGFSRSVTGFLEFDDWWCLLVKEYDAANTVRRFVLSANEAWNCAASSFRDLPPINNDLSLDVCDIYVTARFSCWEYSGDESANTVASSDSSDNDVRSRSPDLTTPNKSMIHNHERPVDSNGGTNRGHNAGDRQEESSEGSDFGSAPVKENSSGSEELEADGGRCEVNFCRINIRLLGLRLPGLKRVHFSLHERFSTDRTTVNEIFMNEILASVISSVPSSLYICTYDSRLCVMECAKHE